MTGIGHLLRESRQNAGMTQTGAEAKTGIGHRSIQRYENDEADCTMENIILLAEAYNDPLLDVQCLQNTVLWEKYLPHIDERPLPEASMALIYAVDQVDDEKDDIIRIMSNGKVDAVEAAEWFNIMRKAKEMTVAGLRIMFHGGMQYGI